jgi:hypothetical protein
MYDRLVIPYPPDSDRQEWMEKGWNPDRLDVCIEVLGDLAIPVLWDKNKRNIFKTRYMMAQAADFDANNKQHNK